MENANVILKSNTTVWEKLRENWEGFYDSEIIDSFFKSTISTSLTQTYAVWLEEKLTAGNYDECLDFVQKHKNDFAFNSIYHLFCGICHSNIFHNKVQDLNKLDRDSEEYSLLKEECISIGELALSEFEQEAKDDSPEVQGEAFFAIADIYSCFSRSFDEYRYLTRITSEASYFSEAQNILNTMQTDYADARSDINIYFRNNVDYIQRQFLFVAKKGEDIAGWFDDDKIELYFPIKSIPAIAQFPFGHPQPNTLYYAHPAKEWFYIPFEEADQYLFDDKVRDFIRLVQCLGATEVRYKSIKGLSIERKTDSQYDVEAKGEYQGAELQGAYEKHLEDRRNDSHQIQKESIQRFNSTKAPFIPNDIVWLSTDPEWQSLVKMRLEGGLTKYSVRISSRKTMSVSDSRLDSVKVAFNTLVTKVNGSFSKRIQQSFDREEETEWEFNITFKNLEAYEGDKSHLETAILSKSEQEYLESLTEFLEEDTVITSRERKMLDRIRQSLGLSEERAAELEASLKPQLTEDEQEYLEMFWEYAERGELTEKERRRLDKFAAALGIDENRIKEIEQLTR